MVQLRISHGSFLVQYKHFSRMDVLSRFTVLLDTHISAAVSSIASPLQMFSSKTAFSLSVNHGYAAIRAFSSAVYSYFMPYLLVPSNSYGTQSGIPPFIYAPPRREGLTCNLLATYLQPTCYLIIKCRSAPPMCPCHRFRPVSNPSISGRLSRIFQSHPRTLRRGRS